jgi:hypothetical protein
MKQLHIRYQTSVAEPLRHERLRRALAIIMDHQEDHHASCSLCQSLHARPTTGRHDCQSAAVASPLYPAARMESVTHA